MFVFNHFFLKFAFYTQAAGVLASIGLEAVLHKAEAKTYEAELEAEAKTHEAEAKTHKVDAEAKTAEAKTHEAEARFFGLEAEASPWDLTSLIVRERQT